MQRRDFTAAVGAALAGLVLAPNDARASTTKLGCLPTSPGPFFRSGFEPDEIGLDVPSYYLPADLTQIHWDVPRLAHSGVDIDYKLTGYDWHNRSLSWRVLSGPAGMSIDADGRLHWVPNQEGSACVSVELRAGSTVVTRSFEILVQNNRCVFVDDAAVAGGNGSQAAPFRTLFDALATVSNGVGRVVYLRGGQNYSIDGVSWYAQPPGSPYRRVAQGNWPQTDPLVIRNFPGEAVRYSFPSGGGFVVNTGVVVMGVELVGGDAGELACLVMGPGAVAKHVLARGYRCSRLDNCTGVKFSGGCLLDRVESRDNYDRNDLFAANSSNYLFYGTSGTSTGSDALVIDCISAGFSVQGFKIKHAGALGRLHLHRCVGYGTRNAFGGASNRSSVRHCLMFADRDESSNGEYVLGLSVTDPSTAGEVHLDQGMLVEHNLVIGTHANSRGLAQADYAFASGAALSARYAHNHVIVRSNAAAGSAFLTFQYAAMPSSWRATFINNTFSTPNPSSCIRMGQNQSAGVGQLNGVFGQGNQHQEQTAPMQRQIAGHAWLYTPADGSLRRDGLRVDGS